MYNKYNSTLCYVVYYISVTNSASKISCLRTTE